MRLAHFLPSGACLFCTADAFQTAGGFDENYYAAEDALFVAALKRQGRFAILAETVVTSGRKARAYSLWSISKLCHASGDSRFPWASESARIGVLV